MELSHAIQLIRTCAYRRSYFDLDSSFELQREDMDKVADFIIKDLDEAAALLPIEYNDPNDFGRVTKGAALALKSRVLLYKASPLFGTPSTEKWQAAANAAKQYST